MLTRRHILQRLGVAEGVAVTAGVMQSLGMFGVAQAASMPDTPGRFGAGRSVIVLGAGFAGLISAYELEQRGFSVIVLEVRQRIGGRAWTIRDGHTIEMIGEATQTAKFSDGVYFNAGPARLPSFHQGILGYARKFGVQSAPGPKLANRSTPFEGAAADSLATWDIVMQFCIPQLTP